MSSTQHKSLARSIEQWQNCDPHAMATRQSYAAIENAFVDAKHDVLALSTEVAALKALRDELARAASDFTLLADRVARLNPDAGEIGAGMLAQLVADARAAIASTTAPQQTGDTQ